MAVEVKAEFERCWLASCFLHCFSRLSIGSVPPPQVVEDYSKSNWVFSIKIHMIRLFKIMCIFVNTQ